ncbi:MAG: uroporphyrinogen-III synthase [Rhodothermales bacterium]|nr:uroporphyrinogen-III synthase [Rhodothermales bacterium]MBO6778713.1 uroporphyrinogen-III synthase [Rhodothermales bacterium]
MRKRVLITRAAEQAHGLADGLERAGFEAVRHPAIAFESGDLSPVLDALSEADWIVFTSANAVRYFFAAAPGPLTTRTAAVGSSTAQALREHGIEADYVPRLFQAEHLAEGLPEARGATILLPQAEGARPVLADRLRGRGARLVSAPAYRTVNAALGPPPSDVHAITFTSPSTVSGFREQGGRAEDAVVACIGPVTASAAQKAGMRVHLTADPSTVEGLIDALTDHFLDKA